MPFTENDGVRIHWQERGSGSPLLLVMGHRFSSRMWWPVLDALSAQHRIVWFDNRGVGQSDTAPTATVEQMVGDTVAVMDAAGMPEAHVYGVSMGGGIILELALRHPERVRSLVLGCIGIKADVTPPPSRLARLATHLPTALYVPLAKKGLYGPAASDEAVAADLAVLKKDPFTAKGVIAQARGIAAYSVSVDEVATIDKPALVLHGTADSVVPYAGGQQLAETIPGARLVGFEGAGHNFIAVDADKANAEVLDFLADVDASAPAI